MEITRAEREIDYISDMIRSLACIWCRNVGEARTTLSHLVSHLVRLHHWFELELLSSGDIVSVHAAIGLRGLRVHEEIHLFTPDLF